MVLVQLKHWQIVHQRNYQQSKATCYFNLNHHGKELLPFVDLLKALKCTSSVSNLSSKSSGYLSTRFFATVGRSLLEISPRKQRKQRKTRTFLPKPEYIVILCKSMEINESMIVILSLSVGFLSIFFFSLIFRNSVFLTETSDIHL